MVGYKPNNCPQLLINEMKLSVISMPLKIYIRVVHQKAVI